MLKHSKMYGSLTLKTKIKLKVESMIIRRSKSK